MKAPGFTAEQSLRTPIVFTPQGDCTYCTTVSATGWAADAGQAQQEANRRVYSQLGQLIAQNGNKYCRAGAVQGSGHCDPQNGGWSCSIAAEICF
jgi:hypothetical protein